MRTRFDAAIRWLAVLMIAAGATSACAADQVLRVGSKRFTESYILGEVLTQTAAAHGKADAMLHAVLATDDMTGPTSA